MPAEPPTPTPTSDRPDTPAPDQAADGRRRIHSDSLLQGDKQIEICHQGEVYRLQLTRLGKLILTK
jgi:hemin uptake protein HemP